MRHVCSRLRRGTMAAGALVAEERVRPVLVTGEAREVGGAAREVRPVTLAAGVERVLVVSKQLAVEIVIGGIGDAAGMNARCRAVAGAIAPLPVDGPGLTAAGGEKRGAGTQQRRTAKESGHGLSAFARCRSSAPGPGSANGLLAAQGARELHQRVDLLRLELAGVALHLLLLAALLLVHALLDGFLELRVGELLLPVGRGHVGHAHLLALGGGGLAVVA